MSRKDITIESSTKPKTESPKTKELVTFKNFDDVMKADYDTIRINKSEVVTLIKANTGGRDRQLEWAGAVVRKMAESEEYKALKKDALERTEGLQTLTVWGVPARGDYDVSTDIFAFSNIFLEDLIISDRFATTEFAINFNIVKKSIDDNIVWSEKRAKLFGRNKRRNDLNFSDFRKKLAQWIEEKVINDVDAHKLIYLALKPGTWAETLRTDEGKPFERFRKALPRKHVIYHGSIELLTLKRNSVQTIRLLRLTGLPDRFRIHAEPKFPFDIIKRDNTNFVTHLEAIFPEDGNVKNKLSFYRWILPNVVKGGDVFKFNYTNFVNASDLSDNEKNQLIAACELLKVYRNYKSQTRLDDREKRKKRGEDTKELEILEETATGVGRIFLARLLASKNKSKNVKDRTIRVRNRR